MKIGILGSSFNPPHDGHIKISEKALKIFDLDEIWWLVTKQNPLKDENEYLSFEDRLNKIKLIINNNKIIYKFFEDQTKSNFLIDNINYIKKLFADDKFIFLMGSDSFIQMNKWERYDDIFNKIPIVVFNREKKKYDIEKSEIGNTYKNYRFNFKNNPIFTQALPCWTFVSEFNEKISSTELRNIT